MAKLDAGELALVERAVAACASEQSDMVKGRKFLKHLMAEIKAEMDTGTPIYTVLTGLWVTIHAIAEEWSADNE